MITDLLSAGLKLLDKVLPDPTARAEAQARLLQLQQAGELESLKAELQLAQGQIDTNKIEAGSADPFVRRWRPAAGWVCVLGLGYEFLVQPLLAWLSGILSAPLPPVLPIGDLSTLLLGLLGLGGLRTAEKLKGRA